jgi:hypothetical protein
MSKLLKEFSELVSGLDKEQFAELAGAVEARERAATSFSLDNINLAMTPEDKQRARTAILHALRNGR